METLQNLQTSKTMQVISTKEKKNIEDAHRVLLILLPALPPPVGVVDDIITIMMKSPGGRIVDIHSGAHRYEKGEVSLTCTSSSWGTILSMNWIPGAQTCDLSSKRMKLRIYNESKITFLLLSRGEDAKPMIAGWVRKTREVHRLRSNPGS